MYLIYVFSFTVASMARLDALSFSDMGLFAFVAIAVVASLLLHALLCRAAGVDADTFMVTSVSAICSPAFVPMLARQVRDRFGAGLGHRHRRHRLTPSARNWASASRCCLST